MRLDPHIDPRRHGSTEYNATAENLHRSGHHGLSLACALTLLIAPLACISVASASTTWTVTTIQDDTPPGNACSGNSCLTLRDAIYNAADGDTIVFDLSSYTPPVTITLTNGEPLIIYNKGITIHGPG
ncbi:MAG: hypothetical protein WBW92_09325, partial [Rhodanobacteraceae bacterium]